MLFLRVLRTLCIGLTAIFFFSHAAIAPDAVWAAPFTTLVWNALIACIAAVPTAGLIALMNTWSRR